MTKDGNACGVGKHEWKIVANSKPEVELPALENTNGYPSFERYLLGHEVVWGGSVSIRSIVRVTCTHLGVSILSFHQTNPGALICLRILTPMQGRDQPRAVFGLIGFSQFDFHNMGEAVGSSRRSKDEGPEK